MQLKDKLGNKPPKYSRKEKQQKLGKTGVAKSSIMSFRLKISIKFSLFVLSRTRIRGTSSC